MRLYVDENRFSGRLPALAVGVEERKTNKHKVIRPDTPTSGPEPSHGRVLFVPWKCPVCPADILSNLCGIT